MAVGTIRLDLPDPLESASQQVEVGCEQDANVAFLKGLVEQTWKRLLAEVQQSLWRHWRGRRLPMIWLTRKGIGQTSPKLSVAVVVDLTANGLMQFRSRELEVLAETSRALLAPDQDGLENLARGYGREIAEASDGEIQKVVWDLRGVAEGYHELGEALDANPSPTEAAEVAVAYAFGYFYELAGGPPSRPKEAMKMFPTGARVFNDIKSWGFDVAVFEDVKNRLIDQGLLVGEEEGVSLVMVQGLPQGDS